MIVRWLAICLLLLPLTVGAKGTFDGIPQHSLKWHSYSQVTVVEDYVVGLSDAGLAVLEYSPDDSSYSVLQHLYFAAVPISQKQYENLMVVQTTDDCIHFVDLTSLPSLEHIGSVAPGVPFGDFALHGNDLYLARWFDGISRYVVTIPDDIVLADISRAGILVTQVEVAGSELYALDEFNGILRYDLSGPSFGALQEIFTLAEGAKSFAITDSTLLILRREEGILIAQYGDTGPDLVDSIAGVTSPQAIFATDSTYIVLSGRTAEQIRLSDFSLRESAIVTGNVRGAAIVQSSDRNHLLVPSEEGGLMVYQSEPLSDGRAGLSGSGPVDDLILLDGKLLTAGSGSPLELYSFEGDEPELAGEFSGLNGARSLDRNGDTLAVLLDEPRRIVVGLHPNDPVSFVVIKSIGLGDRLVRSIRLLPAGRPDGISLVAAIGDTEIALYEANVPEPLDPVAEWLFDGAIRAIERRDTLVIVTLQHRFEIYRIDHYLDLHLLGARDFTSSISASVSSGSLAYLFQWDQVNIMDIDDPLWPEDMAVPYSLPGPIVDAVVLDEILFGIGPDGLIVLNLADTIPEVLAFGGRGGGVLAVENGLVAASDGGSVHLYDLTSVIPKRVSLPQSYVLSQNYPNPFNSGTTIRFEIPFPSRVEIDIFNLLGRRVRILFSGFREAGQGQVRWDGTDQIGATVASGVYLYRLRVGNYSEARKMLLLK